jgi:hypothetical protein
MDYAPHGTLRDRHPKGSILSLATVVNYVKQMAEALQPTFRRRVDEKKGIGYSKKNP